MNADEIQNQPGTSPPPDLVEDLAEELAKLPPPTPSAQYETPITPRNARDQGPLLEGRIMAEMRKPDGSLVWLPLTNQETYLAKSFVPTGEQADVETWNLEDAKRHRWTGFGPKR
jgi:hypothetical protein